MLAKKTHREVKSPQISARYLADYMSASETAKRTIIRGCKYQPIAKIVQHNRAKAAISHFLSNGSSDATALTDRAEQLRNMMADDEFDRLVLDHNADYLDRFAASQATVAIPAAERLVAGKNGPITLSAVRVSAEIHFRLRRVVAKTNEVRVGAGMLRYAKSRPLNVEAAAWQSAFLLGYLGLTAVDPSETPEAKLCITIDAFSGISYPAPGNAASRFKNMKAACESIAERWDNIQPPPGAVL
ncbi:hypothetical protein [Reyranella sp.]|jgi:hypothetical protein|uniref:hypothetical protein n=1 Tax=Reyranella sp. TaxID=1929291 RepID=UPI000BC68829|nr:hypothetical protein [Reyranella sp.]OYZ90442.1 MAG: hypothetical protein B7Y08_29805 [Rhodospirillales bacterium 24-66-33]